MKKRLSLALFLIMLLSSFTACGSDSTSEGASSAASEVVSEQVSVEASEDISEVLSAETSEETSEEASEAASEEASEAASEEVSEVVSEEISEEISEEVSEEVTEDFPASECFEWGGNKFHIANGSFTVNADGEAQSVTKESIAVVLGDSFTKGKISATFTAKGGTPTDNDNGLIFGLEDVELDYFWEKGRPYYFLFVSDACDLYLAKVADGVEWQALKTASLAENGIVYSHGTKIKISAEILDNGVIECSAQDQVIFSYTDSDPLTGDGYGIRGEWDNVCWEDLTVEKK